MDGANDGAGDGRPAGANGGRIIETTEKQRPDPADVVVAYYSRAGTTAQVASDVTVVLESATGERVTPRTERIDPRRERSYWNWLARSFVPGSRVAIRPVETDLRDARAVFLGTPKWTLSCPPVTEFLRQAEFEGTPVGLFLTCGGFDEERYARSLVVDLDEQGADVRATLLVQRDEVGTEGYRERVERFCERVLS